MDINFKKIFRTLLKCIILIPLIKSEISGLDTDILIDLNILNSENRFQSCPSGYIPASGCNGNNCDLNYHVGGNFIYLCQKKKKFKELSLDDKPISKILINYNNNNCGSLNVIDSDLNKLAGGEYVYLCYGNDNKDPSPITDIFIHIKGYNDIPEGYDCDQHDLNRGCEQHQEIYACYKKEAKLPQYIEYSDINYGFESKSITEIEAPNEVIYINNDNYAGFESQTITRSVSKNIQESYSFNFNKSLSFITRINTEFTPTKIPITTSLEFYAEFDLNESLEKTHIKEQKEEIIYKCTSAAREHKMCKIFNSNYKVSLPYKLNIIYHYYDGSKEIEEYQSELIGLVGTSIQFYTCCVKGECQDKGPMCTQEEINNYDFSSGSCPENYTGNNYSNVDPENMVVTDITLISSIYKYMKCPSGYEVINSGCVREGCNLKYFGEGNYTYLCQKKQAMGSLGEGEKPIKYYDILFNEEECKSSLTLVDMNLNEESEGDKIYLCYGSKEKEEKEILQKSFLDSFEEQILQNPIIDFFIFINELNEIPEGYECINKNLNRETIKGKTILLCYTRNYNAFALKEEKEHNLTDNMVVVDLEIVHNSKRTISCPYGYEIVNKGCNPDGCDLNHKAGGEFIYLCQKKELLELLTLTQSPVNDFKIIYNKKDNENLNLIDVNLNQGCKNSKEIFLTYGNNPNKKLSPIVDFFIYIKNENTIPEGYECDNNDLNKGAGSSSSFIYLCYKRNDNLPKEIIINNIELEYSEKVSLGLPETFQQFNVTDGSITHIIRKKVTEIKSMEKSFNFYSSLDVSFSYLFLIELGFNLDFNISAGEEWSYSMEKEIETEITCSAPPGKTMMCYPFITNFEVDIPYKATMTMKNYKGNLIGTNDFYGRFKKVSASQIYYKTCCSANCCTGNKLLDVGKNCADNEIDILCKDIQKCFND